MHSREILEAIQQALYRAGEILEAAAQPGKPSRIDIGEILEADRDDRQR
jgi:hypothetical protein